MGLKRLPYKSLNEALRKNISFNETASARTLIKELRSVKKRQHLTKNELIKISIWKSPRVINQIKRNSEKTVIEVTKEAFCQKNESKKMDQLLSLYGVGIPMASAILTLTDPKRYGVIDIRVWQVLYNLKVVSDNVEGIKFNTAQWIEFLNLLRSCSKKYKTLARVIEQTLFDIHKRFQKGNLYQ